MAPLKCRGWWEQRGWGRQEMEPLQLIIQGSRITGSGLDSVGPFQFDGQWSRGKVRMRKQYLGKHDVWYHGTYDGEGTLSGQWDQGFDQGNWLIRLQGPSTDAPLQADEIPEFQPE